MKNKISISCIVFLLPFVASMASAVAAPPKGPTDPNLPTSLPDIDMTSGTNPLTANLAAGFDLNEPGVVGEVNAKIDPHFDLSDFHQLEFQPGPGEDGSLYLLGTRPVVASTSDFSINGPSPTGFRNDVELKDAFYVAKAELPSNFLADNVGFTLGSIGWKGDWNQVLNTQIAGVKLSAFTLEGSRTLPIFGVPTQNILWVSPLNAIVTDGLGGYARNRGSADAVAGFTQVAPIAGVATIVSTSTFETDWQSYLDMGTVFDIVNVFNSGIDVDVKNDTIFAANQASEVLTTVGLDFPDPFGGKNQKDSTQSGAAK